MQQELVPSEQVCNVRIVVLGSMDDPSASSLEFGRNYRWGTHESRASRGGISARMARHGGL